MIPIFVISLKEATERRATIKKTLDDLGLKFEFFDAIDGRQYNVLKESIYQPNKRLLFFGKHLIGGEIGCLLSHKAIYQKISDENIKQALIFEDDIIINNGFLESLKELMKQPLPFDMIRFLSSPKLERLKLRPVYRLNAGYTVTRHTGTPGGAHATLATLKSAKLLLKHLDKTCYPIDTLMGRSWQTHINWYTLRSGLVAQNQNMESTIGNEIRLTRHKDLSIMQRIIYPFTRAWFKLCETLGKKYWYYKNYFKDKKYGNL